MLATNSSALSGSAGSPARRPASRGASSRRCRPGRHDQRRPARAAPWRASEFGCRARVEAQDQHVRHGAAAVQRVRMAIARCAASCSVAALRPRACVRDAQRRLERLATRLSVCESSAILAPRRQQADRRRRAARRGSRGGNVVAKLGRREKYGRETESAAEAESSRSEPHEPDLREPPPGSPRRRHWRPGTRSPSWLRSVRRQ